MKPDRCQVDQGQSGSLESQVHVQKLVENQKQAKDQELLENQELAEDQDQMKQVEPQVPQALQHQSHHWRYRDRGLTLGYHRRRCWFDRCQGEEIRRLKGRGSGGSTKSKGKIWPDGCQICR